MSYIILISKWDLKYFHLVVLNLYLQCIHLNFFCKLLENATNLWNSSTFFKKHCLVICVFVCVMHGSLSLKLQTRNAHVLSIVYTVPNVSSYA